MAHIITMIYVYNMYYIISYQRVEIDEGNTVVSLAASNVAFICVMIIKSKDIIFFELVYILYTFFVGFIIKEILLSLIFFFYLFVLLSTFKRKLGFCIIVLFFIQTMTLR